MDHIEQVNRVIAAAGGVAALADALNVKQPTVYQWRAGMRRVSPRLALVMQRKWPLVASAHMLRPDIFCSDPVPNAITTPADAVA